MPENGAIPCRGRESIREGVLPGRLADIEGRRKRDRQANRGILECQGIYSWS
jgi:hypothetical protein